MKNILCVDMDNTIIYSYKHDIGEKKLNVELYNGREISFISERTYSLLKEVNDKMLLYQLLRGRKNNTDVSICI